MGRWMEEESLGLRFRSSAPSRPPKHAPDAPETAPPESALRNEDVRSAPPPASDSKSQEGTIHSRRTSLRPTTRPLRVHRQNREALDSRRTTETSDRSRASAQLRRRSSRRRQRASAMGWTYDDRRAQPCNRTRLPRSQPGRRDRAEIAFRGEDGPTLVDSSSVKRYSPVVARSALGVACKTSRRRASTRRRHARAPPSGAGPLVRYILDAAGSRECRAAMAHNDPHERTH